MTAMDIFYNWLMVVSGVFFAVAFITRMVTLFKNAL